MNVNNWISQLTTKFEPLRLFLGLVDIFVLSVLLYIFARFFIGIMRKRSGRLFVGVLSFVLIVAFSYFLNLYATFFVLENFMQFGMIALVVIFQPELRSLLENVGYAGKTFKFKNMLIEPDERQTIINSIVEAVKRMSSNNVGALIVFQEEKELNDYDEFKSVKLNCDITSEIIENIFFKNSPLHDGAMIIRNFRITQARVLFDEISNNPDLPVNLGSRHKAGLGATEHDSKCSAIIISEESGQISFARGGAFMQNISCDKLSKLLSEILVNHNNADHVKQKNEDKKIKSAK